MGGALLMSLNFYNIAPIGAAAELQEIGRLSRSSVFSTCRPPVTATLRPRSVCTHNRSLHVVPAVTHIAVTHTNGWLKSRDTTVSRHQILSALFQHHRVPHTAYAFIFDAPVPPRRTDSSPHIPSSPHDTRPYRLCPVLQRPAHINPACRHLCVSAKQGLSTEHSGVLVPPGARTTSACEPRSIAPHRRTMRVRDLRAWTGEHFGASLFLSLHDTTALPPSTTKLRDVAISASFLPVNSISSSAFGSCILEPPQSRSGNSPGVPASFHTTTSPPLHCHHSGSFRAPTSSLDRSSVTGSTPAQCHSPTAQSPALRHRIGHVALPQAYPAPGVESPPLVRRSGRRIPCDSYEHLCALTLQRNAAPPPAPRACPYRRTPWIDSPGHPSAHPRTRTRRPDDAAMQHSN
ncbi:hypothetical protein B0H14DRAFT_3569015 [Mycena olivaceomarginata]|nr:hypothetical protein B0H14DRAFT_3569015 [Mycena olivaceomarginata]